MFECQVCGNKSIRDEIVSEVFEIDGRRVLVEGIPAKVCERCGEAVFSAETGEAIRRMVHGESAPDRTVPLDVFALSSH
ncbi:MAG: YgiT-type zinc finger protein [Candidatus Omnitrophica bacterium]|nr:YgiT-type zinc finger protein [Candidatus Omnitrophota bacterium]MCA9433481.1 YgiT-type zinc finger protein [Candidatus Omnitrophota bacterium]